jgi:hypothetical protein
VSRPSVVIERDGRPVRVDARIADLHDAAEAYGVNVTASRVYDGHSVCLLWFATPDDAARFLDLITPEDAPDVLAAWEVHGASEARADDDGDDARSPVMVAMPVQSLPHVTAVARAKTTPTD